MLAYRDLSEDEWEAWSEIHHCVDQASSCREDRLAATYEEIEQDMMVSDLIRQRSCFISDMRAC